jgi:TRAP-type mannitol/chloroaromatic compound transport system permease small subunit
MPGVGFVLPHWLYWLGLVIFPLVAMYLAKRSRRAGRKPGHSLPTAYFVWLVGGFMGLHRLYLRNNWGLLYWPLFALILYASGVEREARVIFTDARAALELVEKSITRKESAIQKTRRSIERTEILLQELPEENPLVERYRGRLERDREAIEINRAAIERSRQDLPRLIGDAAHAQSMRADWNNYAFYSMIVILVFLVFDAIRMPTLRRQADADLARHPEERIILDDAADDTTRIGSGIAGWIDRLSLFTGEFVAFWSIIAVFVYYYEVVVRYVFNSPTNWAHESMFLMFGMQYLVAGAYAMLTESHVRVDIFYARMPRRGKAFVDLLTSVFFFIFAGTLLGTSYVFAADAIGQNEVSFTEWAVHYWPVKCVMVVGGLLLVLQGISTVIKDLTIVLTPAATDGRAA